MPSDRRSPTPMTRGLSGTRGSGTLGTAEQRWKKPARGARSVLDRRSKAIHHVPSTGTTATVSPAPPPSKLPENAAAAGEVVGEGEAAGGTDAGLRDAAGDGERPVPIA